MGIFARTALANQESATAVCGIGSPQLTIDGEIEAYAPIRPRGVDEPAPQLRSGDFQDPAVLRGHRPTIIRCSTVSAIESKD
jgi:hypothetical protein